MNVLESPLEALALNYLSLGFLTAVNNLWTWVAVLTAAVSFWRIRASGGSTQFHGNDRSPTRQTHVPETSVANVSADESSSPAPSPANGIVAGEFGLDGMTKGTKFVAVYDEGADRKGNGESAAENDEYYYYWEETGGDECSGIGKCWERELRTRTAEKVWYRYQDLRVLNGNVVRLWENTATSCTRDLRYCSSSCIEW